MTGIPLVSYLFFFQKYWKFLLLVINKTDCKVFDMFLFILGKYVRVVLFALCLTFKMLTGFQIDISFILISKHDKYLLCL